MTTPDPSKLKLQIAADAEAIADSATFAMPVRRAERVSVARKRRKQSRRAIARGIGCSPNTLVALERGNGLVAILESYGRAVGAGLHLAPMGAARSYFDIASSSASQNWETPVWLADLLTDVVGGFDLDPCAATLNPKAARVRAKLLLAIGDDGLSVPWRGLCFVNPPYREAGRWVAKCATEAATGEATVIGLVPARTDTRWWRRHVVLAHAIVFFLHGRLRFGDGSQGAPFPSALIVWGGTDDLIAKLRAAFPSAWDPAAHVTDLHLRARDSHRSHHGSHSHIPNKTGSFHDAKLV
jgi:phage N-6-adenine-methyltransferase